MALQKVGWPADTVRHQRIDRPHGESTGPIKNKVDDLQICGGPKAFADPLHVGQPNIVNVGAVFARLEDIFQRAWLTNNGQYVQQFESMIAKRIGVRNCVATCNGTLALQLAIRALDLSGEVIVPSFTFLATAHALAWQNIKPVFADIDPRSGTIDPDSVQKLITPQTTGILGVHLWGNPCPWQDLQEIAERFDLKLLYDACHAFGCEFDGVPIGNFGDAEVFSFHATKFVHAAEGGAVVTNDDALAKTLREMRNFGFSNEGVNLVGTNAKMTEVSAAIGISTLESIEQIVEKNRANRLAYESTLDSIPHISVKPIPSRVTSNCQYIVVEVADECPLTRDELLSVLHTENVLAKRYFHPGCHRLPAYRDLYPNLVLPMTDRASRQVLVLPTGVAIGPMEIGMIGSIIRTAICNASRVQEKITVSDAVASTQPGPVISTIGTPLSTA